MLLAGIKTDIEGFGWRHLCDLLADSQIESIVKGGLTERERLLIDYCVRIAYSFDHSDNERPYRGSGANIACSLSRKLLGWGYDYGSPYSSHDNCECASCVAVRRANARLASPFNCAECGRHDEMATSPQPTSRRWICPRCLEKGK